MKHSLVMLSAVAILVAAVSASAHLSSAPAAASAVAKQTCPALLPPAAPAGQVVLWGHIKTMVYKGSRFEMRFDPALLLHGVTASRAALEDTGSSDVPNDSYVVDESHRLFTYVVPATAHVTVLAKSLCSTSISVAELAQIVKGKNPKHRPLFSRDNGLGFWIRVGSKYPNPALELDQQYQP